MKHSSVSLEKESVVLSDPTVMPNAIAYLWNKSALLTMNCRGYASAQFMQPEPATYACGPSLEQTTFFQPEKPYHSQHPGRFFYIHDRGNDELYSLPFAPCNRQPNLFKFIVSKTVLRWVIEYGDLQFSISVELADKQPIEYWRCSVTNIGTENRSISIYSYFTVGFIKNCILNLFYLR